MPPSAEDAAKLAKAASVECDPLPATRYKIKPPTIDAAIYITVVDKDVGDVIRPWELFIETKNPSIKSKFTLVARLASAVFRSGGPVSFVASEFLDAPMDGGYYLHKRYIPSIAHHIGLVLEQHLNRLGISVDNNTASCESENASSSPFANCPSCGQPAYVMSDGCGTCNQCGYSKCG